MAHPFGERDLVEQKASKEPMTLDSFGVWRDIVGEYARHRTSERG